MKAAMRFGLLINVMLLLMMILGCAIPLESGVLFGSFKVLYDGNGNTEGTVPVSEQSYASGETIIIASNTGDLSKNGVSFSHWNTRKDDSGAVYTAAEKMIVPRSDIVLYAQYSDIPPVEDPPVVIPPGEIDEQGWTEFAASSASRIVYVSSAGNDSTGQVYSLSQVPDPFNPGTVNAFATIAAASARTRNASPDWILLRRGDTFSANITLKSGASAGQYALLGAYGNSLSMPVVHPLNTSVSAVTIPSNTQHSVIQGIDFYAVRRNPAVAGYTTAGTMGISAVTNQIINNILIEGCRFRFFTGNRIQGTDGGVAQNIKIRRTVISDNYSNGTGHAQGLYMAFSNGIVLEENIFDHNGWYNQAPGSIGTATIFNHNTYFEGCHNVLFTKNIFSRGSSMGNKFTANTGIASSTNITLTDNLYLDGEIGIGIGGNTVGQYRFRNVVIEGNIFTEIGRSRPTNRTLAWALDSVGWDGGSISDNYFLHFSNAVVTNAYGIRLEGGSRNVRIEENVVYNLNPHGNSSAVPALLLAATRTAASDNITVARNRFQEPVNQLRVIQVDDQDDLGAYTFTDNQYFTSNQGTAFRVETTNRLLAAWSTLSGDNSTFVRAVFPDPTRSIVGYMRSLGATETIDAFIGAVRNQGRNNWDNRFSAALVVQWIKTGFQ